MSDTFNDNVVWITGGGSGIGEALAVQFAHRNATVAVSGRRPEPLETTVRDIEDAGGRGLAVPCDVTKVTELEEAVDEIVDQTGRLDVAVANAGYSVAGDFQELTAADWKRQFDTNVVGLAMTVKAALPHLEDVDGRAVLMGSVAGTLGPPNQAPYASSKWAVRGIGQCLNADLAGTGVTCTTLMPGFVESEIGKVDNKGQYRQDWDDRRPHQLMWSSERAARKMIKAIEKRRAEAVITGHGKAFAFLANHAPRLTQTLMRTVVGRFVGDR